MSFKDLDSTAVSNNSHFGSVLRMPEGRRNDIMGSFNRGCCCNVCGEPGGTLYKTETGYICNECKMLAALNEEGEENEAENMD